ncbi:hypothetical protein M8C21_033095 [Ambrosia artemisiifolia]|uniref:Uncharacterized protein n=1 Tax=Ambrosia artemisiifolia TaxID=4212 RepID=A0AAD5CMB8_AMBAR|nr:hypothetical protein M8C21_033095 [Ambrosia artemisiifolia]
MKNNNNKNKPQNLSPSKPLLSLFICVMGLASSYWLSVNVFSINLIQYSIQTLPLFWMIQVPVVIMVYSVFRKDKNQSSYLKAVARGLLGLPVGAVVNALGAIALGAPVGSRSSLRLLSMVHLGMIGTVYLQIQIIGAWFGAWPMPLDWERMWQEWPICVTYGAIIGYLVGMLASFGFLVRVSSQHVKGD